MCRAVVFRFLPTCVEIVAVASLLSRLFHPALGFIVAATSIVYTWYTVSMTQVTPDMPTLLSSLSATFCKYSQ